MTSERTTENRPTVYAAGPGVTVEDLEEDVYYLAEVNGVVPYGIFVDVNERISGLVHESKLHGAFDVGDEVIVQLETIQPNGDVAFESIDLEEFGVEPFEPDPTVVSIADLEVGMESVTIEGRVDQINQTGGPTVITVTDGHRAIPGAAFEAAGVRAYPELERGDVVRVLGSPRKYAEGLQFEVDGLTVLSGGRARTVRDRVENEIESNAEPADVDPLVEWDVFDRLEEELQSLAMALRRSILESRPVRIRHHADGDGMCAAVPLTIALERFAARVHRGGEGPAHLVSRAPSKAPYYDMEDATRDLNRALEQRERYGQRLPMLVMLDNGSTEEDVPAYRNLAHYDIPIAVVDHHHPDPEAIEGLLAHHLNPYLVGEDYRLTTGMVCVELARLIDPDLTAQLSHVPAVAGVADRSAASAMQAYLDRAADAGYDRDAVDRIGRALDYAAHWLEYRPGSAVVRDTLGVGEHPDRHAALVDLLTENGRDAIETQLAAATTHLESETLPNGATLHRLDVDRHAHRFRYPAPGKTTGAVHDAKVEHSGDPTVTIGYGPDFCVLRSDGVRLDIPAIVDALQAELPGAGVSGGGHLVVGSIRYVPGRRESVLKTLIEHLGEAPIDPGLTATGSVPSEGQ